MYKYLVAIFIFFFDIDRTLSAQAVPVEFRGKSGSPKPVVQNKAPDKVQPKGPANSKVQKSSGAAKSNSNSMPGGRMMPNDNRLLTASFSTTETCDLEIDGKSYGTIQLGVAKPVSLAVGRHQLKAMGKSSLLVYKKTFDIVSGDNQFLIPLAEIATDRQRQKDSLVSKSSGNPVETDKVMEDSSGVVKGGNDSSNQTAMQLNIPADSKDPVIKDTTVAMDRSRNDKEETAFKGQVLAIIKEMRANMVQLKGGMFKMVQLKGAVNKMGGPRNIIEYQVNLVPFSISKYEVTQQHWEAVMGSNPSFNKNCNSCPVENVSWEEVNRFIQILNELGGVQFRLPTEAEWQFVAQLDGKSEIEKEGGLEPYLKKTTWYMENARKTHPVGGKTAHASGVYDLFGNVSEWCSDWYGDEYTGNAAMLNNPTGPANGTERVIRGGAFNDAKIVQKDKQLPEYKSKAIGFRLVTGLH